MERITLQPKVALTRLEERVIAGYVLFRPGLRAHNTHIFRQKEHDARLSIDVDRRNVPIGMEIVQLAPPAIQVSPEAHPPIERLLLELFAFASQMAWIGGREQERALLERGDEILRDILDTLPFLHDEQHCA